MRPIIEPTAPAPSRPPDRLQPLTYSVPEVARLLGINRNTAYELVARGQIPSIKLGRRVLVPRKTFEQMLAAATR